MKFRIRDAVIGAISGGITCFVSVYTLAYTAAIAMPSSAPPALWEALVTLGLGVFLVTFVLHSFALWVTRARLPVAFIAFVVAVVGTFAMVSTLFMATNIIVAWLLGALLASLVIGWHRSNYSFEADAQKTRAA